MNRDVLERPFDRSLIKSRKGPFGQALSYVEGAEFIKRLNEAFESCWSFEVVEHHVRDTEVIVLGKLTAENISKSAFGSSSVTISRDGEVISIGDDLKGAATDALKKCCTLLGLGLHLYQSEPPSPTASPRANSNGNGRSTNGANNNRLTQRQLSAIWSMGRSLGLSADQIRQRSVQAFGVVPEHLSKSDASSFIQELGEGLSGAANAGGS